MATFYALAIAFHLYGAEGAKGKLARIPHRHALAPRPWIEDRTIAVPLAPLPRYAQAYRKLEAHFIPPRVRLRPRAA
jgi:hypothetical protein